MIIRLYPENNALPIGPAVNRVGSALPLRIVGAPSGVTGVAVSVFNADGAACNLDATRRGGEWVATVPASHFASWGKIARGLQVAVSYKDETDTTQTVVFVGDVRIEQTAAGDPEGTGRRSVPVTDVDEVEAGSSMKDIRDKVNEIAKIISGTATALVLMALPLSAATPLEDIPGTNEVYTAAETDARIIELAPTPGNYATVSNRAMHAVQTETDPSVPAWAKAQTPPASMTTNVVCAIVTNEVPAEFSKWTLCTNGVPFVTGIVFEFVEMLSEWELHDVNFGDGQICRFEGISVNASIDALTLEKNGYVGGSDQDDDDMWYGNVVAVRTFTPSRNALGLARLVDLPPLTNGLPAQISNVVQAVALPRMNDKGYGYIWWGADGMFNIASLGIWFNDTFIVTDGDVELCSGNISFAATNFTYNGSPVATYQSIATAADAGTNYTDSAIAAVDTSYPRVIGITNINQTVQYVSIDSAVPSTLSIMLPTTGDTKDWIVYVTAQTNVSINLPAATWWLSDTATTNDIAPQTPTALYFSQAADGIYTLGRQEFTEVQLP